VASTVVAHGALARSVFGGASGAASSPAFEFSEGEGTYGSATVRLKLGCAASMSGG
jgi:hypothetical protein